MILKTWFIFTGPVLKTGLRNKDQLDFNPIRTQNKLTVCPRSSDPFYIVTYYIKWVSTSWTDGCARIEQSLLFALIKAFD